MSPNKRYRPSRKLKPAVSSLVGLWVLLCVMMQMVNPIPGGVIHCSRVCRSRYDWALGTAFRISFTYACRQVGPFWRNKKDFTTDNYFHSATIKAARVVPEPVSSRKWVLRYREPPRNRVTLSHKLPPQEVVMPAGNLFRKLYEDGCSSASAPWPT